MEEEIMAPLPRRAVAAARRSVVLGVANLYVVTTGDTGNRNDVVFQNATQP